MSEQDENINPDSLSEDNPDDGGGSVESQDGGLKDTLGKVLGKNFPDDESALKAVKDTFSYVSQSGEARKAIEAVAKATGKSEKEAVEYVKSVVNRNNEVDTSKFVSREEFEKITFYGENPDYREYKSLVETYKKANQDKSYAEVIQDSDFKEAFEKVKAHDTTQKQKSVLHSNQRLGMGADKMNKAKEASQAGNQSEAEKNAVGAVLDAFDI